MTVKLITEDVLEKSHFLSATEQEGEYVGQPALGSNSGNVRLRAKGTLADYSYTAATTGAGAGGGTTTVVSYFIAEGDDLFIGGTVTCNDGANAGESQTITDFAQSTGTFTHAAFSNQVAAGVSVTIEVAFDTRDFQVEITESGDIGDAAFKWSHDGGTTYFGREDPQNASHYHTALDTSAHTPDAGNGVACCQLSDGTILIFYLDSSDSNKLKCKAATPPAYQSSDFSAQGTVYTSEPNALYSCLVLGNGRVLVYYEDASNNDKVAYSDDDGSTWTSLDLNMPVERAVELDNGVVLGVYGSGNDPRVVSSIDGGLTFSTSYTTVLTGDTTQTNNVDIEIAANGNVVVAYKVSGHSTALAISTNSGGSFDTTGVAVGNADNPAAGDDWTVPRLIKDVGGDLLCFLYKEDDTDAYLVKSTDNGETWSDPDAPTSYLTSGDDLIAADAMLLHDGKIFVAVYDDTNDDVEFSYVGGWEVYNAGTNDVPTAIESIPQELICGVELLWQGRDGIDGDTWSFEAEYEFAMENIIDDSPKRCWRSTQDNTAINIVIDMGAAANHYVTGVGFFGCNVRTLDFQMNDTDAWGGPSVDETISFDLTTGGTIDSLNDNYINDASLLAGYKDHALKGYYLRLTGGAASGGTYEIIDNVGDHVVVEGDIEADGAAATDTFAIFQPFVSKTFTGGVHRYMRIAIGAQHTADDYYQIGTVVLGYSISLSRDFAIGYKKTHMLNVDMLRSKAGALIPVRGAGRRKVFELQWPASENATEEVLALTDYAEGKNICLIPSTATECYLVKLTSDAEAEQVVGDKFNLGPLVFEEVL